MQITRTASGKKTLKMSKSEWTAIGKKAGWATVLGQSSKWWDSSDAPTDRGNEVGSWDAGWLNGTWKCPNCQTIIGRNLKNQIPFALVEEHKKKCSK